MGKSGFQSICRFFASFCIGENQPTAAEGLISSTDSEACFISIPFHHYVKYSRSGNFDSTTFLALLEPLAMPVLASFKIHHSGETGALFTKQYYFYPAPLLVPGSRDMCNLARRALWSDAEWASGKVRARKCWSYYTTQLRQTIELTLMLLVANLANTKWCKKTWKMTETLAHGYSCESNRRSNEYQHDRV